MPGAASRAAARAARRLPPVRGRARVADLLYGWAGPSPVGSFVIQMQRGHRMVVPLSSAQSWRAAFTGRYDDGELDLLDPAIAPDSFVLDIGACLGFYTVPMAAIARSRNSLVLAVEPVVANCE